MFCLAALSSFGCTAVVSEPEQADKSFWDGLACLSSPELWLRYHIQRAWRIDYGLDYQQVSSATDAPEDPMEELVWLVRSRMEQSIHLSLGMVDDVAKKIVREETAVLEAFGELKSMHDLGSNQSSRDLARVKFDNWTRNTQRRAQKLFYTQPDAEEQLRSFIAFVELFRKTFQEPSEVALAPEA